MISIAVAQDFIEHELSPSEDAELRASLHLSPSTAQSDFFLPGAFGGAPNKSESPEKEEQPAEEVEKTMLAGLIERILARLSVKVSQIEVRLVWSDGGDEPSTNQEEVEEENELKILIDQIEYLGDANSTDEGQRQNHVASLRAIKVSPPQVLLTLVPPSALISSSSSHTSRSESSSASSSFSENELAQSVSLADSISSLPPPSATQLAPSDHARQYDSESESDSSGDDNDLLALSQSIADLRTSTTSLSQSRTSGSRAPITREKADRGLSSIDESGGSEMFSSAISFVSATSAAGRSEIPPVPAKEKEESPFTNPDSPSPADSPTQEEEIRPNRRIISLGSHSGSEPLIFHLSTKTNVSSNSSRSSRSRVSLELSSTLSAGWIVALTTTHLTALIKLAQRLVPSPSPSQNISNPLPRTASPSPLDVSILLNSITLFLAYPDTQLTNDHEDTFSQLWNSKNPASLPATSLKVPHLRLSLEELKLTMQNGTASCGVKDLTFSEILSEGKGEKQAWKALPILVSDNGLKREGSSEVGGDWKTEGAGLTKDWRIKAPAISGFGGGIRRKSNNLEDVGAQSVSQAIKVSLNQAGNLSIDLSPLHLFIDLTILSRLSPVFDSLSAAISEGMDGASTPRFNDHRSQPSHSRPLTPAPPTLSQDYLLDDLSPVPQPHAALEKSSTPAIQVHCPLLRIDLRCPAPARLRLENNDQNLIRGGLVQLELDELRIGKRDGGSFGQVKEARIGMRIVGARKSVLP
jgi:autophagy-related protein 2